MSVVCINRKLAILYIAFFISLWFVELLFGVFVRSTGIFRCVILSIFRVYWPDDFSFLLSLERYGDTAFHGTGMRF